MDVVPKYEFQKIVERHKDDYRAVIPSPKSGRRCWLDEVELYLSNQLKKLRTESFRT